MTLFSRLFSVVQKSTGSGGGGTDDEASGNGVGGSVKKAGPVDTELAMYGVTLINKTLYGIPDQDTFYDQVWPLSRFYFVGILQSRITVKKCIF